MMQSQKAIRPYWIFRGYSELESGYRIRFIATVPASAPPTSAPVGKSSGMIQALMGNVFASETSLFAQQQQGTLPTNEPQPKEEKPLSVTPQQTSVPQPKVSQPAPENTTPPENENKAEEEAEYQGEVLKSISKECIQIEASLIHRQNVNGIEIGMLTKPGAGPPGFFYIPDTNAKDTVAYAKKVFDATLAVKTKFRGNTTNDIESQIIPQIIAMIKSMKNRPQNVCPIKITGLSPTLFFYGTEAAIIRPFSKSEYPSSKNNFQNRVTYSDPGLNETNVWNVYPFLNSLKVNGVTRDYLYYEYNHKEVNFNRPEKGWIVSRRGMPEFAKKLSAQFGFSEIEASRLLFELNDTSKNTAGTTLRIGLISRNEIDTQLPLSITTNEYLTIERIFFYIESTQPGEKIVAPLVSSIPRPTGLVLELGGYTP